MFAPFEGSEDVAFDGNGSLAGKNHPGGATGELLLVDAGGAAVALSDQIFSSYGVRYAMGGDLLVAEFIQGRVMRVTPAGGLSELNATPIANVNGLHPDFAGRVWYTNFTEVGFIDAQGGVNPVVTGEDATSANGIVFDEARRVLFWSDTTAGGLRRADIDEDGAASNVAVVAMVPARADGLTLDACGNVYAVDQAAGAPGTVFRFNLDDNADLVGAPEDLLTERTPQSISNAQFGRGAGWSETTLYAAGNPGTVYAIEVGVPGALQVQ